MQNEDLAEKTAEKPTKTEAFDLVVIGAGVAGLNALYAATEYLAAGAKVLLIDQKPAAGGMWNTAYDYVRLHQPHPMFTVGDMKWAWNKPSDYLAARDEVQAHLASSLQPVAGRVSLDTRFSATVTQCEEVSTQSGFMAQVVYHPVDDPQTVTTVLAQRAIFAPGLDYKRADPLEFSSSSVVSATPATLTETLAAHPDAPVCVVGGGKTGMDSVLAVIAENPARTVSLIKGRGTNFLNRTRYIPTGMKRWTSGRLVSRLFHDLASVFDGDNEDEVIGFMRRERSVDPETPNGVFLYGLQSEDERARIEAGLSQTFADYLSDVADADEGPQIVMRSGATEPVAPGTIFVNCTGSFFRAALAPEVPCLSPNGTVLSITARDAFHFLTSVAGFFCTHLLYRDELRGRGFYTLDQEGLFRKNRNAWVGASAAQAYLNQAIAVQTLPIMLLDRCGLDLDRWYPFPRRMVGLLQIKTGASRDIAMCRKTLDRVAERFDVRCAPLE